MAHYDRDKDLNTSMIRPYSVVGIPTSQDKHMSDLDDLRVVFSEETEEGGVIRMSHWPEGYVLFLNGQIVWREWEHPKVPIPKRP